LSNLSAKEVILRVKALNKFVVAGGPLFTNDHAEFDSVDCFVLNEGEITIPMFLEDLEKGNLKRMYSSLERPDVTLTPIPDWSLIKMGNYASMATQISRGCPFNCEFCDIVMNVSPIVETRHALSLHNRIPEPIPEPTPTNQQDPKIRYFNCANIDIKVF
jgi:radical SAM superfamily enzyme YgiQ (UPF0313 family)